MTLIEQGYRIILPGRVSRAAYCMLCRLRLISSGRTGCTMVNRWQLLPLQGPPSVVRRAALRIGTEPVGALRRRRLALSSRQRCGWSLLLVFTAALWVLDPHSRGHGRVHAVEDAPPGILLASLDGGPPVRLTDSTEVLASVFVRDDGDEVAALVTPLSGPARVDVFGTGKGLLASIPLPDSGPVFLGVNQAVIAAWSPDGAMLAYAYGRGTGRPLHIVDIHKRRVYVAEALNARVLAWHPQGTTLAVVRARTEGVPAHCYNDELVEVDGLTGAVLRTLTPVDQYLEVDRLAWSPDGRTLAFEALEPPFAAAVCAERRQAALPAGIWRWSDQGLERMPSGNLAHFGSMALFWAGPARVVSITGAEVRIYDANATVPRIVKFAFDNMGPPAFISYQRDLLMTGGEVALYTHGLPCAERALLFDLSREVVMETFPQPAVALCAASLSPDSRHIAYRTAGDDARVLWVLDRGDASRRALRLSEEFTVWPVAWSAGGHYLLVREQ